MKFASFLSADELSRYKDLAASIKKLMREKANLYGKAKQRAYRHTKQVSPEQAPQALGE